MNVLGISSNTYNILATLFKHIFDENEFAPRAHTHQGGLNNTVILSRAETSWGGGRVWGCDTPPPRNIVIL